MPTTSSTTSKKNKDPRSLLDIGKDIKDICKYYQSKADNTGKHLQLEKESYQKIADYLNPIVLLSEEYCQQTNQSPADTISKEEKFKLFSSILNKTSEAIELIREDEAIRISDKYLPHDNSLISKIRSFESEMIELRKFIFGDTFQHEATNEDKVHIITGQHSDSHHSEEGEGNKGYNVLPLSNIRLNQQPITIGQSQTA